MGTFGAVSPWMVSPRARPVKILHMDKLYQLFPDFDFGDADEDNGIL